MPFWHLVYCDGDNCWKSIYCMYVWGGAFASLFFCIASHSAPYILCAAMLGSHCAVFRANQVRWWKINLMTGKATASMSFRKFPRLLITIHCWMVASLLFIVVVSVKLRCQQHWCHHHQNQRQLDSVGYFEAFLFGFSRRSPWKTFRFKVLCQWKCAFYYWKQQP